MSRQRLFRTGLILLLIGITFATSLVGSNSRSLRAQSFAATLNPVAGLIQILPKGKTKWVNVTETTLLHPGDQVRTGNDGLAEIHVITGIEVDIYPTSRVKLNALSLQEDRGEVFDLHQLSGTTFTDIKQTVSDVDHIQISLPTASVRAHGTKFFVFVDPNFNAGVFSLEHQVEVLTMDNRKYEVAPEDFLFIKFQIANPPPLVCTAALLKTGSVSTFVSDPLDDDKARIDALREFLKVTLLGNLNPPERTFLRQILGLPEVDLASLTPEDDKQELQDLLDAVGKLDTSQIILPNFLGQYLDFWASTYKASLLDQFPPATCGNGQVDEGETPEFCPSDFSDPASCGNGICETDRNGLAESLVSCPADCLPDDKFASSCVQLADTLLNPSATPTTTLQPSGVGR